MKIDKFHSSFEIFSVFFLVVCRDFISRCDKYRNEKFLSVEVFFRERLPEKRFFNYKIDSLSSFIDYKLKLSRSVETCVGGLKCEVVENYKWIWR